MYIDKTDLWTADTDCLQESKWNQKCQSCVPNTRHQITGGSPSSPIASVWSQSSLLVNKRWHDREYFPIEINFSGFISFFWREPSSARILYWVLCPLQFWGELGRNAWIPGPRALHTQPHTHICYVCSLWLHAIKNSVLTLCIVSLHWHFHSWT